MVGFVAYWLVFHIVGSMLYLVGNGTELWFVIPRLRLVDDIILSCKSFPALSLWVSLAFLVQPGHETSCLEACLAGGWCVVFFLPYSRIWVLNWNDLQQSVWNGSRLPIVTGDRINRYRADKWQTDRPDSDHHMIDRSTPVLHLWPNKNKHGLCALTYYYIYRVLPTV